MTRKRIIILGAKPDPNLLQGDVIYCANAAIGLYPQYIKNFSYSAAVMSSFIFRDRKGESLIEKVSFGQSNLNAEKKEMIFNAYADKYVVTAYELLGNLSEVEKVLGSINRLTSFEFFSRKERRNLIRSITQLKEPYLTKSVFHLSFDAKLLLIKQFLEAGVGYLKGKDIECPSYCRISTGLFCLIYAIREHGLDCSYVLIGIGSDRKEYKYKLNGVEQEVRFVLRPHLEADLKALKKLSERYQISTSDFQLSQAAGIDFIEA